MAGQHLIDWGLPSLMRVVAAKWDAMTSHNVWRNPWRHALRQSSRKLITVRLLYNLVVSTLYSEARVSSPVREAWVEQIWRKDCYTCSKSPLSTSPIQSESNIQYGWFKQRRSCCQDVTVYSRRLPVGTPAPDLSSRLTREAFSMTGYGQKTAEVWIVFLLLFELPSQANESHLPEATWR